MMIQKNQIAMKENDPKADSKLVKKVTIDLSNSPLTPSDLKVNYDNLAKNYLQEDNLFTPPSKFPQSSRNDPRFSNPLSARVNDSSRSPSNLEQAWLNITPSAMINSRTTI